MAASEGELPGLLLPPPRNDRASRITGELAETKRAAKEVTAPESENAKVLYSFS